MAYMGKNPRVTTLTTTGVATLGGLATGSDGFSSGNFSKGNVGKPAQHAYNGNFATWLRGTSFTSGALQYTADRWAFGRDAGAADSTMSRTTVASSIGRSQYAAKLMRSNGTSGTGRIHIFQLFTTDESRQLNDRTVALSFLARKGSSFSAASDILRTRIVTGTGTDESSATYFSTGLTGAVAASQNNTLTTGFEAYVHTATLSTIDQVAIEFSWVPTGSASDTNDYCEITDVMLTIGTTFTPFMHMGGSLGVERNALRRFCFETPSIACQAIDMLSHSGSAYGSGGAFVTLNFPVPMFKAPTLVASGAAATDYELTDGVNAAAALSALPVIYNNSATPEMCLLDCATGSGLTQYRPYFLRAKATGAKLLFTAEL